MILLGSAMRKIVRKILFPVLFLPLVIFPASADDESVIRANGGWSDLVIDSGDLVSGAGSDLAGSYESDSDATLIDIHKEKKDDSWRLDVRRSDGAWDSRLSLYIRRTGGGAGNGDVSGGLSYVQIGDIDRQIMSGNGLLNNIPLQYRLTGVSLQLSPGTYSTTVIFTLMDK